MNYLQLIPSIHRQQPILKVDFDFDKDLVVLGNDQNSRTVFRAIQELLGHGSSKTTEIYTHVSKKSLANIKSPLDYIIDNQKIDNEQITNIKT